MFTIKNGLEYKYNFSSPAFKIAFGFLKRDDLTDLPVGWIELENGVRASIQQYNSFQWDENKFESHEKYFDIQYVVKGCEICGVCNRDKLNVAIEYDSDQDIVFYDDPKCCSKVLLNEGDFIILAPEDAHKPRCMLDKQAWIRKVVLKVPVEV